jgi:hypothetical protein
MTFTYCKQCVMPTSRPGLVFDEEGICSACRWHEKKASIDWMQRAQQFQDIAYWAKAATHAPFDCVLGVSGGKDSLWQAHQLRDRFGLNPLLVQYVSSDGTELGRLNAENMVRCGFTLLSLQPNPQIATRLARKSFLEHGNIVKASELALFTAPFRTALDYDIPLVLFGENPALEAGDVNRSSPGWDASGIRYSNTLSGAAVEQWLDDDIERRDLIPTLSPLFPNWNSGEDEGFSWAISSIGAAGKTARSPSSTACSRSTSLMKTSAFTTGTTLSTVTTARSSILTSNTLNLASAIRPNFLLTTSAPGGSPAPKRRRL